MKRKQKTPSQPRPARIRFPAFPFLRICFGFRISNFEFPAHLAVLLFLTSALRAGEPAVLGYTEPYRIIHVSAAETGVIAGVFVGEGAAVKKGDLLAKLDTATLEAELEIARAEAKLQTTRRQRIEELNAANRATPEELDKARSDLTIKQAQVRKIEAMIETRLMRSPVDGVVTEIRRDPSEAVSAANPHVLTVVQIDRLAVNLYLTPAAARTLTAGCAATIELLGAGEKVPATVEFVSPVTDSASGTVRVKFVIENPAGALRSGGRCTLAGS